MRLWKYAPRLLLKKKVGARTDYQTAVYDKLPKLVHHAVVPLLRRRLRRRPVRMRRNKRLLKHMVKVVAQLPPHPLKLRQRVWAHRKPVVRPLPPLQQRRLTKPP